jgi:hypothetical protein
LSAAAAMSLVISVAEPANVNAAETKATSAKAAAAGGSAQVTLRNISDAVRRVRSATLNVISDVEQRPLTETGDPLFLDAPPDKPKDLAVWTKQQKDFGKLEAPKKSWLDADVAHLKKAIALLNSEMGSTGSGDGWAQMNSVVNDINTHFKQLQQLSAGPKYDNIAIGGAALRIHDDVTKLEKPWRDTMANVRKGGKP